MTSDLSKNSTFRKSQAVNTLKSRRVGDPFRAEIEAFDEDHGGVVSAD